MPAVHKWQVHKTRVFPGTVPNLNLLTWNILNLSTKTVVCTGSSVCHEWHNPTMNYERRCSADRAPSKEMKAQHFFRKVTARWPVLMAVRDHHYHPRCFLKHPKCFPRVGLRMTHSYFNRMRADFLLAEPSCQFDTQHVSLPSLSVENRHLSQTILDDGSGVTWLFSVCWVEITTQGIVSLGVLADELLGRRSEHRASARKFTCCIRNWL